MTGLILLSSYPKSGNTWLRAVIDSLKRDGGAVDVNANLAGIVAAADRQHFDRHMGVAASDLTLSEIAAARPKVWGLDRAVRFVKTHDAWLPPAAGAPLPFVPAEIEAAVYVVRDPRDVAVSFADHFGTSVDAAIAWMADRAAYLDAAQHRLAEQLPQFLSSWSDHVRSWIDAEDMRLHVLRYEDMHADPTLAFTGIARFLGLSSDPATIAKAIAAASFKTLRAQEDVSGFSEREPHMKNFFRRGVQGGWRDSLTPAQAARIVADHTDVMARLGYIEAKAAPRSLIAPNQVDAEGAAEQLARGDAPGAAASARAVIAKRPSAEAFGILAAALSAMGRRSEARAAYGEGFARFAQSLPLAVNYARFLRDEPGAVDEAIGILRGVIAAAPDAVAPRFSLIETLRAAPGRMEEAEAEARAFIDRFPADGAGPLALALILHSRGALLPAIAAADRCIALGGNASRAWELKANAFVALGAADETIACYRAMLGEKPDADIHSRLLMAMQYSDAVDETAIFAETKAWVGAHAAAIRPRTAWDVTFDPEKPLSVGIVSRDFRLCSTLFLARPLFDNRPSDWQVTFYSNAEAPDDATREFRAMSDHWYEIAGESDDAAAAKIAADRIDVLVDINGHTLGGRPGLFARKPAPVQVAWLDYVGTTGLAAMDAIIADAGHLPLADQPRYVEPIRHVADNLYRYHPLDAAPAVGPLPAAGNGFVTFGCFNAAYKFSTTTIALWAEVLRAMPGSRLLLNAQAFRYADTRARFSALFAARGIAAGRIDFRAGSDGPRAMLASYNDIDIALDPTPYSGGLTTLEALYMGVPVITMPGQRFGSRHSTVHLRTVGLADWVAADKQAYVDLACRKAADLTALAALRAGLREKLEASPLMDGRAFARDFAAVVRDLWRESCARQHTGNQAG